MTRLRSPGQRRAARALTIDDLARVAGTTTRNVRALQATGLVPRPRLVARTGYYDEEHLERLRAVLRLQARGFSLVGIGELLRAWEEGRTLEDVLGLPRRRPARHEDDAIAWIEDQFREKAGAPLAFVPEPLARLVSGARD